MEVKFVLDHLRRLMCQSFLIIAHIKYKILISHPFNEFFPVFKNFKTDNFDEKTYTCEPTYSCCTYIMLCHFGLVWM